MRQLTKTEVAIVSGGGAGHVASCVSGGALGARVGSAFGPWGGVAGAVLGCGTGLFFYDC